MFTLVLLACLIRGGHKDCQRENMHFLSMQACEQAIPAVAQHLAVEGHVLQAAHCDLNLHAFFTLPRA